MEAFLGGRPAGGGYGHLYVAVVDDDGTVTIYSAGPDTGSGIGYVAGDPELRPMANVQATDAAAFERDRNNPNAVVQLPTEIPDEVVHAVGEAALGHPDYDTGVIDTDAGQDGANSNSFARAIVERSAEISGVDPESIRNPQGVYPLVNVDARVEFDPEGLQRAEEIMEER